jgi:uncharacterized repeat protein (TIGR01451 family)
MADVTLTNLVSVTGDYGVIPTELVSDPVVVQVVNGLTIMTTVDQQIWATGNLTYTVTIENGAEEDFTTPVFTNELDTLQVTLVENSVQVDDIDAAYNYTSGILSIDLPTIVVGESVTITFQVQKI